MSGSKKGVAPGSNPESDKENDDNQETPETQELSEETNNISAEKTKLLPAGGDGGGDEPNHAVAKPTTEGSRWWKIGAGVGMALGATAAVVAAPIVIGAMGFGAGGIAAGSYAASMMSSAAIANGGGIAAGSLVATLQSIGVVGLGAAGVVGVGTAGATVGAGVGTGVGLVADRFSGKGNQAEEGAESTDDGNKEEGTADEDKAGRGGKENFTDEEKGRQSRATPPERMSIVVAETDGRVRRFDVVPSQPLQRLFDLYYDETGSSPESVQFEFNDLPLDGSETPSELRIENDDVIRARRI